MGRSVRTPVSWPALCAAALIAFAPLSASAQGWQLYSFPEAGFAVQFPEPPLTLKARFKGPKGVDVPAALYQLARPGALFTVTVADFTGTGVEQQAAIEAAVKDWSQGGEVKLDVVGRIDRQFGRQLSVMRADGARAISSVFFVNNKLYLLEGRLDRDSLESPDASRFQQSLELIGLGAEAFRPENRPQGEVGRGFGPPGGRGGPGGRPMPPPEAYESCKGKTEGAAVAFTGPRGREVQAVCAQSPMGLVARPNRPPPGFGPPGSGPPEARPNS